MGGAAGAVVALVTAGVLLWPEGEPGPVGAATAAGVSAPSADAVSLASDSPDFDPELLVALLASGAALRVPVAGPLLVVGCRGDRQSPADPLDPVE